MDIRLMRFDFYVGRLLVARRQAAVAVLEPGERVGEGIRAAAEAYCSAHGAGDVYAWVRRLPEGAPEWPEVAEVEFAGGTAILLEADWAPDGWVIVGRGGDAVRPPVDMDREAPYCEIVENAAEFGEIVRR